MIAGLMSSVSAKPIIIPEPLPTGIILSTERITALQIDGFGLYLGTFNGNDNPTQDLNTVITNINESDLYDGNLLSLDDFQKIDEPNTSAEGMTITYNTGNSSGSWTTTEPIEFYTVKGSGQYSIWWMKNDNGTIGATSGNWTTEGLTNNGGNQPSISHLTTWNDNTPSNNVPEPTILSLLGLSLLGLGFFRRKK
jgi:hypothetical protein